MLEDILREAAARSSPVEYPSAYYSADGDCVFFYNEGGEYERDRVDQLLTVFRAPDDARILGLQIKGVKRLPADAGIGVEVSPQGIDPTGRRVDVVRILLLSYREQCTTERDSDGSRTGAYVEALEALGCRSLEVELV